MDGTEIPDKQYSDIRLGMLFDNGRERRPGSGPIIRGFLKFAFQNHIFHFSSNDQLSDFGVCPEIYMFFNIMERERVRGMSSYLRIYIVWQQFNLIIVLTNQQPFRGR
jgi:hypothetical protein